MMIITMIIIIVSIVVIILIHIIHNINNANSNIHVMHANTIISNTITIASRDSIQLYII